MPDLRLTDAQVADVATYLSTLKGPGGDAAKATPDQAAVDAVLLDYFEGGDAVRGGARRTLAKAGPAARSRSSSGSASSPGTAASAATRSRASRRRSRSAPSCPKRAASWSRGSISRSSAISRTRRRLAWFETKLHDPRIFDRGRVLQPLEKLRMPNFDFTDEEVERLVTAIMSFQREIQPPAAMPVQVGALRLPGRRAGRSCTAATASAATSSRATAATYLKLVADPSLGPPLLTPEGARVQPDWLYAFLRGPITIRPWLDVRMPTFGLDDPQLNGVISYFGAISNTIGPFQTHEIVVTRRTTERGRQGSCSTCCSASSATCSGAIPKDQPTANLAPDLRMAPERLQPGLDSRVAEERRPAILPGTRMPAFWPDYPKSPFPQLGGRRRGARSRRPRPPADVQAAGPSPKSVTARLRSRRAQDEAQHAIIERRQR